MGLIWQHDAISNNFSVGLHDINPNSAAALLIQSPFSQTMESRRYADAVQEYTEIHNYVQYIYNLK